MAKLYRKSLLEKLQSPDQLDKMVKINPPSFWIAIGAGILVIVVALIWAFVGTIPEKVDVNGVYLHDQNTYTISSEVNGIVNDVNVKVGDEVREGETLYSFDSDSLKEELKSLEERLEKVKKITLTSTNDEANQDTQNLLSYKAQYISSSTNSAAAGYKVALEKYEKTKEAADEAKRTAEKAYNAYASALSKIDPSAEVKYKQQIAQQESLIAALDAERAYYQDCVDLWNLYYTSPYLPTDWTFNTKRSDTVGTFNTASSLATSTGRTITNYHSDLLGTLTDDPRDKEVPTTDQPPYTIDITINGAGSTYSGSIKINGTTTQIPETSASEKIVVSTLMKALSNNESKVNIVKAVITGSDTRTVKPTDDDYTTYSLPFTDGTTASSASYQIYCYATWASYRRYDVSVVLANAQSEYQALMAEIASDPKYSGNAQLEALKSAYDSAVNDYQTKAQLAASAESSLSSYEANDKSGESSAVAQAKAYSTQFLAAKGALVDQLEKEIDKYEKQIDQNTVTASMDGIVTNLAVNKGTAVSQGTATVVIRQKKEAEQVVLYASLADGKKIEEGMKVNIYPTTLNRSEYGHMSGVVSHVAEYVTTKQEIFNKVGDESLASMFTSNGSVIEIVCELETDDTSVNGYAWSTEKGRTVSLKESTIVQAEVITDEQHPISILIPFLKDKLENITKDN